MSDHLPVLLDMFSVCAEGYKLNIVLCKYELCPQGALVAGPQLSNESRNQCSFRCKNLLTPKSRFMKCAWIIPVYEMSDINNCQFKNTPLFIPGLVAVNRVLKKGKKKEIKSAVWQPANWD